MRSRGTVTYTMLNDIRTSNCSTPRAKHCPHQQSSHLTFKAAWRPLPSWEGNSRLTNSTSLPLTQSAVHPNYPIKHFSARLSLGHQSQWPGRTGNQADSSTHLQLLWSWKEQHILLPEYRTEADRSVWVQGMTLSKQGSSMGTWSYMTHILMLLYYQLHSL